MSNFPRPRGPGDRYRYLPTQDTYMVLEKPTVLGVDSTGYQSYIYHYIMWVFNEKQCTVERIMYSDDFAIEWLEK